jgi:tetratricopeptide (TPR) repeat protein
VRYVVEGSVRKAGKRVRITAQLIEAATGGHVWADRYDRDMEDIFTVQDEVTKSIAAAVPGQLESDIVKASRRKPTENLDAYDYYLRGKQLYHGWRDDDMSEAIAAFEAALKLGPTFARAHAKLGQMYLRQWWRTAAPNDLEVANRETGLAVRLDNEDSECLCYRGFLLMFIRDFDGSLDHLQRAQRLKPDDPEIGAILALFYAYAGDAEDAIERVRGAMRANPHFPPWYHEVHGIALTTARRYEEAVRSFLAIPSPAHYIHIWLAGCLAKLGRLDEARAHARTASNLKPGWTPEDWAVEYKNEDDIAHAVELGRLAKDAMEHDA